MPVEENLSKLSYTRGPSRPLLELTIGDLLHRTAERFRRRGHWCDVAAKIDQAVTLRRDRYARDEAAAADRRLDQTPRLGLGIGPGHRADADTDLVGQRPLGRQSCATSQTTAIDVGGQSFDDLGVGRPIGRGQLRSPGGQG